MSGEEIAGRYRLIEPLGHGAMSSVWLADDPELGRRVAVKLLSPAADRARFEREARAAASLSHPNLCSLYDYGESDGKPFMVLEYLPNGSLEELLKGDKPLPDRETHRIATEIAAGLAHAHERGLVHRDLKPANVLFDSERRAKIADFGIARMGDAGALTEAGTVLGTASYISPEQASGQPAGPASDVYSFGVILFRMLTGRLPFVGTNAIEVVRMHRDNAPPAVAEFRADAPVRLESLTAAALAKNPAHRPADGAALLRELRGTEDDATMVVAPRTFLAAARATASAGATQVIRPAPRARMRRRGAIVAIAVAALLLLGGGVAVALVTTGGGSAPGSPTLPGLSVPTVAAAGSSSSKATTAATTAATASTTTAATTTHPVTTTPVTTQATVATTAPTVPPTTTVAPPPPATVATTTAPVTTVTTPTTTATTAAPGGPTTTSAP